MTWIQNRAQTLPLQSPIHGRNHEFIIKLLPDVKKLAKLLSRKSSVQLNPNFQGQFYLLYLMIYDHYQCYFKYSEHNVHYLVLWVILN